MGFGAHHAIVGGWTGSLGHGLLWLLFVGLALFVVWSLTRTAFRPQDGESRRSRAIDELAGRFARGEIDAEEYFTRRSVLEGEPGTP